MSPPAGAQPAVSSPAGARRGRVLVVVLAGGAGGRLGPLTRQRSKPSLPFAGMYRLIDVALSNVSHSELDDVWVLEQFEPHDLNDHLANGRPWDLDRTHGGLRILPPFQRGDGDEIMAAGNADALVQHRHLLSEFAPEVIVTLSADHLFQFDLRDAIDSHRSNGAAVTMVTTDPPADDDQSRFAWVEVTDSVVTGFEYKPDEPTGDRVCTEVFVFDAGDLLGRLDALPDDGSAGDYGDVLIPDLVADGRAFEHRMHGYWRDIGTIGAYHRAHMELVADEPPLRVDDPAWPLITGSITGGPAHVMSSAEVHSSLLGPGALVAGTVHDSVVGRRAVVEAGALVRTSVILDGAVVRAGATVDGAIVDVATTVDMHDTGDRDDDSGVTVYSG